MKRNKMEFESERLIYREIRNEDLEFLHLINSTPDIDEFNTLGIPENIDVTRKYLQSILDDQKSISQSMYCWLVFLKESNESIGICGFSLSNNRFMMGKIYYNLLPVFWGNGFATEIAKQLINIGLYSFKLHRIEAGVATQNQRSIKVLEKAGMIREGIRRKILPIRGAWFDNYHYAIVEGD